MCLFSETIIKWYDVNKRDLPWRQSTDPYIIWISEVILQQTRVVQGYQYFVRFINRFPDIATLANASEDEVMKHWQGLGYYSRARNLHAAAKGMDGEFPTSYNKVLELKGVGDYTAAAICSFAYNLPYAVVDGNVYRVLSRYFGIETPIDTIAGKKLFAELAQELLDKQHPAMYNQAIMDFGALQCTPQSPICNNCPLIGSCMAYAKNQIKNLPIKKTKTKISTRYLNYFLIKSGNNIFIHKRTNNDIWKNLYELPLIETSDYCDIEDMIKSTEFLALFSNIKILSMNLVANKVKHVLSHRHLFTNLYKVEVDQDNKIIPDNILIPISELDRYPTSKLIHSLLEKYM